MKLYGYTDAELPIEEIVPKSLGEVTLCATPTELRKMSDFFIFCASEMERIGSKYDHIHLSDKYKEFEGSPHFVLMKNNEY